MKIYQIIENSINYQEKDLNDMIEALYILTIEYFENQNESKSKKLVLNQNQGKNLKKSF